MKFSKLLVQRRWVGAVLAVILAVQCGCVAVVAGAAAGAGAVAYVRGELQAKLDRRYEVVERAANHAIEELQFKKISENKDALTAIIVARTAEDTKVQIKVLRVSDNAATVQIRVGLFGNEALSRIVLDKIKEAL